MSQDPDVDVDEGAFDAPGRPSSSGRSGGGLSIPGRVVEFGRDIRAELRQVAWPTRAEVISAAVVVLGVLVVLVAAIFGLNWLFSHAVNWLYKP